MAPAAGNNDGEAYHRTVFLTTSLDTRLVTTVSCSDSVSDFKERIMLEHRQCFPAIGRIEIHTLKVKRRGGFYHLSDSMPVKSAFRTTKRDWFVYVDASSLDQHINNEHFVEHKVGDLVALPWVTHNCSFNRDHNHEPSTQPKTVQTFSNTDGDFRKDVSQNVEEDRPSVDKQLAINKKIISKKRTREVSNENLLKDPSGSEVSVKKKRKTQKVKSSVKATEENIVSTYDDDEGKAGRVSMDSENSFEHKSKNKDLIGENTRINNGKKCYHLDQVAAVIPSGLEGVGKETDADVAMVVEKNSQHGMCDNKKENELVLKAVLESEIPSSSTRTSDCERDATRLNVVGPLDDGPKRCTKLKPTEKEVSFQNINKDAIDSSQQDVGSNGQDSRGDLIDKLKEDRELSLKQGPEVKLPERRKRVKKSATKNKKETLVMCADDMPVGDICSTILAPSLGEKIIGEKNEVLGTPLIDDSKKNDEMILNKLEVSEPTNSFRNQLHVETTEEKSKNNLKDMGSRKRKKDVEKTASQIDKSVVKQSNDVETSIDALHVSVKNDDVSVNNDVEVFRTEKKSSQVHVEDTNYKSENQNGIINGVKKDKRKKRNKKSASRNEDTCPQDWLSKDQSTEVELESKKNHHLEDISNVTAYEVSKVNNEVDTTDDGSHEKNILLDRFAPGHQPNKTASIDNGKNTKKPKKKTKDDSKNDSDIQSLSKNEGLVGKAMKNSKSSLTGPQVRLESEKSKSIDHCYHPEDTSNNVTVSEVSKVNNKADIITDGSHEINVLDHFAPGNQPNKTVIMDDGKDTKKPKKKKKKDDSKNGGDTQEVISKNEGLVGLVKKNNKSSETGPQDWLSKHQSTEVEVEVELESEKSQSINHRHHVEDTSKNVTVSEVLKVNNEVDITNDESHEINFMDHFAPEHQPNETASIDNGKNTRKPKKKINDSKNDGDFQSRKIVSRNEGVAVNAKKNNKYSRMASQDQLSKVQSTEIELELEKSQSIDHHGHLEDTTNNVTVSEVSKVNNEVDITNDESHEINFMDHFAPGHQPNKTASVVSVKDANKPKKKINDDFSSDGIQSQKTISKIKNNKVVTDPNIPNIDQIKIPRTTSIDSKSSSSSKSFARSYHDQKGNKQQSVVGPVKKDLQVVNSSLNKPAEIFGGDDSDRSSADDNATVNSDSTRTPSRRSSSSSSSGENAFSIELRRNRSHAMNVADGGKKSVTSQNESKKVSMTDILRRSSRFKKAKFNASQVEDTESQPVDFVPDSQLLS